MGIFDFFRKSSAEALTPDLLRQQLFDAIADGEYKKFQQICRDYSACILRSFPDWNPIPEEMREDPAQVRWYGQGMVTVAQYFAEQLGDSSLLQSMGYVNGENPLDRWHQDLTSADQLMQALKFEEAADLLENTLDNIKDLQGTGADKLLPVTLGKLGDALFQCGKVEEALGPTREALHLCEKTGDQEGVVAYLGNLCEINRYLANGEEAARFAIKLADNFERFGDTDSASHYRQQAAICGKGEPLLRIVVQIGQQLYETDQLPGITGHCQFIFKRNRISLASCERRVERGVQVAETGAYLEALSLFEEAAEFDAFAPEPHFHAAFTLLHLRRYEEAAAAYVRTEKRAPGWYHCRSDRHLAEELAAASLDHDVWLTIILLEDSHESPEEKLILAQTALAALPELAQLHLHCAINLQALGRSDEAATSARLGLKCVQDTDTQTRLHLRLGLTAAESAEREDHLQSAISLNGNLVAAATARICLMERSGK